MFSDDHPDLVKNTRVIARNHYSQLTSHEGALSSCALNLSWAIMGHHGLFLTTDYNIWLLDLGPHRGLAGLELRRHRVARGLLWPTQYHYCVTMNSNSNSNRGTNNH